MGANSALAENFKKIEIGVTATLSIEENILLAMRTWQDVIDIAKTTSTPKDVQYLFDHLSAAGLKLNESTGVRLSKGGLEINGLRVSIKNRVAQFAGLSFQYDKSKGLQENIQIFKRKLPGRKKTARAVGIFFGPAYADGHRVAGGSVVATGVEGPAEHGSAGGFLMPLALIATAIYLGATMCVVATALCVTLGAIVTTFSLLAWNATQKTQSKLIESIGKIDCDKNSVSFGPEGQRRKVSFDDLLQRPANQRVDADDPVWSNPSAEQKEFLLQIQKIVEASPGCSTLFHPPMDSKKSSEPDKKSEAARK